MNANFSEWDDNVFFKKQYELFLTKKKKSQMPKRYIQTLLKWDDNIYFKKCQLSFTKKTNKKNQMPKRCIQILLKWDDNISIKDHELFLT